MYSHMLVSGHTTMIFKILFLPLTGWGNLTFNSIPASYYFSPFLHSMLLWSFTKFLFLDGLSASNSYLVPTHLLSRFEVRVKMSADKCKHVPSIQKMHPSYFWTFGTQPDSSLCSTQLHRAWHHSPLSPQVPEISSRFTLLPLAYSCPHYNLASFQ